VTSAYSAVNEAQRQLVDGLFQQVGLLNDEIEKLKSQVAERDRALTEAKTAIDMLTREVAVLKGSVRKGAP
jgi:peptidoglycan hydrolase CwlO-like protein